MLTSPLFAKRTSGACTSTVSADPISGARAEVWGQTTAIIALTCGFAGRRRRASASWMPGKRACRVKKLDRRSDLAVRQLADLPSHCPDALVHPVPVYMLATPPARPLRPRRAGSREGRAPSPAQGPPSRRRASPVHGTVALAE